MLLRGDKRGGRRGCLRRGENSVGRAGCGWRGIFCLGMIVLGIGLGREEPPCL